VTNLDTGTYTVIRAPVTLSSEFGSGQISMFSCVWVSGVVWTSLNFHFSGALYLLSELTHTRYVECKLTIEDLPDTDVNVTVEVVDGEGEVLETWEVAHGANQPPVRSCS
jgi:hypothetical protein